MPIDIDTRLAYALLVALVAVERLFEMVVSRRNVRHALGAGAKEFGAGHYPWMVALHASFLVACPVEVVLAGRPFVPLLGLPMLALLVATMTLRYWVVLTLGARWNTRIVLVPGATPVRRGPFRFMRHPNYLAVTLELIALPLVHSAWFTALAYGLANAALLRVRIRAENRALGYLT